MAEQNEADIKKIVKFYKKVYHVIAIVVLIIGIILLPVIPSIVGDVSIADNIRVLFFVYLLNTVFSYLLTYKRSILYADQKNYITMIIDTIFVALKTLSQIIVIYILKSYLAYLIVQIVFTIVENIFINCVVNKKYKYVKDLSNVEDVSTELKGDIKTKVKGLLFHKIGTFVVLGTDNIIISMTKGLGVISVGMYTNYNMIINQVKNLFSNIIQSLTASIGNLLLEDDKFKARNIYKSILLVNSWLFCFGAISIYCLIEPFVTIWIGNKYILSKFVLIVLIVNLYLQGVRSTSQLFKDAGGIFYEDRFIPLLESLINLIASIILVKIFGLAGVFLGTIVSTMLLFLYSYPKYVYKLILHGSYNEYLKIHLFHFVISLVICLITGYISSFINMNNACLDLLLRGIVCLIIPNIMYLLCVIKLPEFQIYKDKIEVLLKKYRSKKTNV